MPSQARIMLTHPSSRCIWYPCRARQLSCKAANNLLLHRRRYMRSHEHKHSAKALVCDADDITRTALLNQLSSHESVKSVDAALDIPTAQTTLRASDINAIFFDPLIGLDEATRLIFRTRELLPEIVFVLYLDIATAEARREVFYQGERRRFGHYYKLDKATPVPAFPGEVDSVVRLCQSDLSWRLSRESLQRLKDEQDSMSPAQRAADLQRVSELVEHGSRPPKPRSSANSVFLSYRFAENEYAEGLLPLLEERGFTVVTGKRANTYISKAVLDRIGSCEYFLCLMTRDKQKADDTWTTSPWLLEEKGAALALGKQIVLMVEEGVDDFGGLQGDWQRIHFGPKGFLKAALQAVRQLASYSGQGDDL